MSIRVWHLPSPMHRVSSAAVSQLERFLYGVGTIFASHGNQKTIRTCRWGVQAQLPNQNATQNHLGTKICLLNWDGSQMSCFQYPWKFRCSSAGWWWEDQTPVPWKRPSQSQPRRQASQPHMSQELLYGPGKLGLSKPRFSKTVRSRQKTHLSSQNKQKTKVLSTSQQYLRGNKWK